MEFCRWAWGVVIGVNICPCNIEDSDPRCKYAFISFWFWILYYVVAKSYRLLKTSLPYCLMVMWGRIRWELHYVCSSDVLNCIGWTTLMFSAFCYAMLVSHFVILFRVLQNEVDVTLTRFPLFYYGAKFMQFFDGGRGLSSQLYLHMWMSAAT